MASSSRTRSSSPFGIRKASPTINSHNRMMMMPPRYGGFTTPASSASSYGSSYGGARSVTPSRARSDSVSISSDFVRYNYGATSSVDFVAFSGGGGAAESMEIRKGKENVCVTVRFRPLSSREYQKGDEIAWYADGDTLVRNEYNPSTYYAFDRVFGPATTTIGVYDVAARHVVRGAMEGVNGTVFAYGVTSSGKTHTMHGDQKSPGIIPLAIKDVFDIIQDTPGQEFLLRVSYLEIYNEVINDLLDPTGQNLRIREDAQGTYVESIKEEVVLSPAHALSLIAAGEEHRHVGSNNFNLFSSRSHTIFTLTIESSNNGDGYDEVTLSQLNLIDLAGSESSKTETTGLRRKEGAYINKSLLTLGTVIGKLSEGKASHIPYRDSKLTRLLQSSLSGHGHVSLICTVTPASSNMEETHNTLKFANRAKRVEIRAAQNRIIDEKSLIKKYQKEINSLKTELDQLKRGILVTTSQEELITLRQQLEAGQAMMQSRLEEEEQAKAALMGRIQKLTKLILVSTKNSVSPNLMDISEHRRQSSGEEEKLDGVLESTQTVLEKDISCNGSPSISTLDSTADATQDLSNSGTGMSDHMDLLIEQVKVLAGEVAFNTSTLKRLTEQAANNPDDSKIQAEIQNLEIEIEEKKRQMKVIEQRITGTGDSATAASPTEMQKTISKLMSQCNEKAFELEIKSADNRILQDRLQVKELEIKQLQNTILSLHQKLNLESENSGQESSVSTVVEHSSLAMIVELENLKQESVRLKEANDGLEVQCQKLSEEASYAKELASAAAVELKILAEECTKISFQNSKLSKEVATLQESANARSSSKQALGNGHRKAYENRMRKPRLGAKTSESIREGYDEVDSWSLDIEDMKREIHARKEREAILENALVEKEQMEADYQKRFDECKRREADLENDLAGMWVLVAKLKKERVADAASKNDEENTTPNIVKTEDDTSKLDEKKDKDSVEQLRVFLDDERKKAAEMAVLIARLKSENLDGLEPSALDDLQRLHVEALTKLVNAKTQMQTKPETSVEENASHVCKVCFEGPAAAVLLPCRHFCLCKPCAVACVECPLCRTKIQDRIIAFTS